MRLVDYWHGENWFIARICRFLNVQRNTLEYILTNHPRLCSLVPRPRLLALTISLRLLSIAPEPETTSLDAGAKASQHRHRHRLNLWNQQAERNAYLKLLGLRGNGIDQARARFNDDVYTISLIIGSYSIHRLPLLHCIWVTMYSVKVLQWSMILMHQFFYSSKVECKWEWVESSVLNHKVLCFMGVPTNSQTNFTTFVLSFLYHRRFRVILV